MKYALIGCGRISPNHIAAAKANGLEFVGICDINKEMLQDKVSRFDLTEIHQYSDYREMLEKEKPELVAIATESGKHAAIALNCIKAGCHVIIEKPIALSLADADMIIKAAKEKLQEKAMALSARVYEEAAKASQANAENADTSSNNNDNVKEAEYEEK